MNTALLFIIFLLRVYAGSTLNVSGPPALLITRFQSDIRLPCSLNVTPRHIDPQRLRVTWRHKNHTVAHYSGSGRIVLLTPRVYLARESLKDGDASLLLSPVDIEDEGRYVCQVAYDQENQEVTTHVVVRAAPRVLFTQGPDSVLNCSATGFYPAAISFTIGQHSKEVKMERPAGQLLPDGTFRADSTVNVRAWRAGSDPFYCEVRHEALDQPIRTRQQEDAIPKVSFKLYSEVENLEDTVQCIATGFNAPEIMFTIFRLNSVVKQKELVGESQPDGTYEAKLVYTFMKNHENFRELQCMVTHASMDEPIRKHLIVPLTIALQNRAELDKVSDMICVAERFLNPVEYFVWRKGEEVVYSEAAPKGQMPDGTYTAVSWYRFTPSSRDQVSCEVQYQHTKTTRRYVTYTGQSFTELFIVGIVILGPLLLILIIILWHSSVFLSPIVPEKMIYDEPGMLTCSMSGWCLRMVSIKWFLNEEEIHLDAEEDEDKDEDDDNMWESQSDMSGYSMKRGHISRKGCCKAETTISLKFTPNESEHEDRAFKCQATHRMTRKRVARVLVFESEGQ